nr:PREDICTED: ARF GTPase-activating protein GIT1-like [Apteryx mantelli mantelli]
MARHGTARHRPMLPRPAEPCRSWGRCGGGQSAVGRDPPGGSSLPCLALTPALTPSFVPCSEKIHSAVTEMASLFPKKPALETVRSSLRLLNASAYRLQSECRKTVPPEPGAAVDYQLLTQQVIQCAYDIAKAAKQLVTITTREKKQ